MSRKEKTRAAAKSGVALRLVPDADAPMELAQAAPAAAQATGSADAPPPKGKGRTRESQADEGYTLKNLMEDLRQTIDSSVPTNLLYQGGNPHTVRAGLGEMDEQNAAMAVLSIAAAVVYGPSVAFEGKAAARKSTKFAPEARLYQALSASWWRTNENRIAGLTRNSAIAALPEVSLILYGALSDPSLRSSNFRSSQPSASTSRNRSKMSSVW